MSTLLIDLGNSALKWAPLGLPEEPKTAVHEGSGVLDHQIMESWQQGKVVRAYGCTVASEWLAHSVSDALRTMNATCNWLQSQTEFSGGFSLKNHYKTPHLLGSDRWHAAIGAVFLHPQESLLVVHMGTATTVDSVVPENQNSYAFLGGRIAPGPALMREGLARGTAHLPRASGTWSAFPENTIDAISTGIIDSQLGLIDRAMREMQRLGVEPRILLAGGAAKALAPFVNKEFESADVRHNLVLHGLATRVNSGNI